MLPRRVFSAGFTLVELLTVISIIGVLLALLLPAVQHAREGARCMQCQTNLSQIALALQSYCDSFGSYPAGQFFCADKTCASQASYAPGWGWSASILPFVEQEEIYDRINFSLPMADESHTDLLATPIPLFQCPTDRTRQESVPPSGLNGFSQRIATSSYCGNGGSFGFSFNVPWIAKDERITNGIFGRNSSYRIRDITDGLAKTILVGEVISYRFYWDPTLYGNYNPNARTACCTLTLVRQGSWSMNPGVSGSQTSQRESFSSLHAGGAYFAMCDGSVRFIDENIDNTSRQPNAGGANDPFDRAHDGADYRVWQRLFSRNDGLMLDDF
jgi:prepilin-type N-terminal cleavage/methylation domain-containing protein/prepilin-type processing-associated H-X9-DG protein